MPLSDEDRDALRAAQEAARARLGIKDDPISPQDDSAPLSEVIHKAQEWVRGRVPDELPDPIEAMERQMNEAAAAYEEARTARWNDAIPAKHRLANLNTLDAPEKRRFAERWAEDPSNALLTGLAGRGKTFLGVALLRDTFDQGHAIGFFSVGSMLRSFSPFGHDPVLEAAVRPDVILLDGLGDEPISTDYQIGRLYDLFDKRWSQGKPVIATSNLPAGPRPEGSDYEGQFLSEVLDPRTFSRLMDGAIGLRVKGDDRRRVGVKI